MDRTVATGTGFIGQYPPDVARVYERLKECPDELLLFMHHVPYTYVLHSGKTVIQHVYDSHYAAAAEAQRFPVRWEVLNGLIDQERYNAVLAQLTYQAGHAIVWRDAICSWFLRESGIADSQGRAGHFPGRTEAEAMKLDGYVVTDVAPWEDASGGKAIVCKTPRRACSASFTFSKVRGTYDIVVRYFDLNPGEAEFQVRLDRELLASWKADAHLPGWTLNGDSSTRYTISHVELRPGQVITIEGSPDQEDRAAIDYVELHGMIRSTGSPR
jgi:alpha-glucuronidase